jgi:K+-transporting ATPase ATPase C chain
MTGAAQVMFPNKADGDPTLIGRDYSKDDNLFQSRPSVTGYAADATFFNNQGPNQLALADQLKGFMKDYLKREQPFTPDLVAADVPPDAVTTSASGVDPQISADNARIQANRVATERSLPLDRVLALVDDATSRPLLGLGGPKSVNVVKLNDALEAQR